MASACWDVPKTLVLPSCCTHTWAQYSPCLFLGLPSLTGLQHHPGSGLGSSSQSSRQATASPWGHCKKKYICPWFFILKAESGAGWMLVWVAWFGRSWRAPGGTRPREHPLPWTCPHSWTLPTQPNLQQDLARLFGAEAGEETWPTCPGGSGWGGRLPIASSAPGPH